MSKFRHQIPEVSALRGLRALLLNHHCEPRRPATNLDAIKAHKGPSNHIKVYKACEAKPTCARRIRPYPIPIFSKLNHLVPHFVPKPSVSQCLCGAIPSPTRLPQLISAVSVFFCSIFPPFHGTSRPIRPYPTANFSNNPVPPAISGNSVAPHD